ncbi:MAG: hypothetical protein LBI09_01465 [Nitrososphaerota archaeon]|jgi:hypothetical protein|nr:hypothetical protein [Nitrososphaerota archaeon]
MHPKIVLEVVSSEAGTNLPISKRSRSLRHIILAVRMSARIGCIYQRGEKEERKKKKNEENS